MKGPPPYVLVQVVPWMMQALTEAGERGRWVTMARPAAATAAALVEPQAVSVRH